MAKILRCSHPDYPNEIHVTFRDRISYLWYRWTNLWRGGFDTIEIYYLVKAVNKVVSANYDVVPDEVVVYSWRRMWLPIKYNIKMVSATQMTLACGTDRLIKNNQYSYVEAGECAWVYWLRNENIYVIGRAKDADLVKKKAHPEKGEDT